MRRASQRGDGKRPIAGAPLHVWLALTLISLLSGRSIATAGVGPANGFDAALAEAAEAGRQGDLPAARRALTPWTSGDDAAMARTVLGLLSFVHHDPAAAVATLEAGPAPPLLTDWRWWALAGAHEALGEPAGARQALDALLAETPDSPLRARALVRQVAVALAAGDRADARRRLTLARAEHLPISERVELEQLAWSLANDLGDPALLADVARRMLVLAPLQASKLRVVDVVAARQAAAPDWRLWLEPGELEARADALLDADLPAGALTTLAAVPETQRGFSWRFLEARALTAANRGSEAYAALTGLRAPDAATTARLEWLRAEAANEASTPRRGRAVDVATSQRYRQLVREHRLGVVRTAVDPPLAKRALAALASDYLDEEKIPEAVAALRQLVALDPTATTGARRLWEYGWTRYEHDERTAATAAWRELVALYPRSTWARSGRYWTARALESAGDAAAAKRLYLELLAADTADFYARQAGLRLAGATQALASAPPERDPWPHSPTLARAERLAELGLEPLARIEIELVGERAAPRAAAALRATVLARLGDRRGSLAELRDAFPDLGTAHQAHVPNEAIELFYPLEYRQAIETAARRERLSASLVLAMIHQESGFDAAARSRSGARGLMQLMPATGREIAQRLGLPFSTARLNEPEMSVRLGSHYIRQMLDRFDGSVELALAGYNGGPGRISRLWRAAGPSPELDRFLEGLSVHESKSYVKRILVLADSYRSLYPDLG